MTYEYEVQGDYGHGHGYECVTTEVMYDDAMAMLACYRENEPGVPFRCRRVPIIETDDFGVEVERPMRADNYDDD